MRIALDVMGGDHAPHEIIAGALKWSQTSDTKLILVGREDSIAKELQDKTYDNKKISIVPASQIMGMDESATALRTKKDSSIAVATRLVKEGEADAVVSCGSTGAQMAAAVFILGRLEHIERPPIVAAAPGVGGKICLLLDVGANVDCKPQQLLQFAALGRVYASIISGEDNPRVALLNNGEEESKGNSLSLEAHTLFRQQNNINFVGNIEGRDLFFGKADVVVCDGFTGNILLKSLEGMAMFLGKECFKEMGKLPIVFQQFDYSRVGGAPLLGVNGVSIVCHGSSKSEAVFNGIKIAEQCIARQMVSRQIQALNKMQ
ncbi:MAG: phosphate acyltransferase PlsX [Syntrophomonas sp.]|nr:phosphate acyltransferase PlsX [Syntrophomonas sp.]